MSHYSQNTEHTEQRKYIENYKRETLHPYKDGHIRITAAFSTETQSQEGMKEVLQTLKDKYFLCLCSKTSVIIEEESHFSQ